MVFNPFYQPSKQAVEWCVEQHLINRNNLEWYAIGFVGVAWIFLSIHSFLASSERFKKYSHIPVQLSRLFMLLYFSISILVLQYRLLWVG